MNRILNYSTIIDLLKQIFVVTFKAFLDIFTVTFNILWVEKYFAYNYKKRRKFKQFENLLPKAILVHIYLRVYL